MTDTKTPKDPEVIAIQASKPGRKRRFTAEEKQRLLQEADTPGETISSVARRYGVSPSLMFRWRNLNDHGSLESLGADEHVVPASEVKGLKNRVRELERLLGKKTMEVEILKEAVEIAREKKLLLPGPSFPKGGSR
jgi:transposase